AIILLAASPVAKWGFRKYDTQVIGRELEFRHLRLNLINGSLFADKVVLKDTDGSAMVTADTIDLRCSLRSLAKGDIIVRKAIFKSPAAYLIQQGDSLNIAKVLERFTGDDDEEDVASESILDLNGIQLRNAYISYRDIDHNAHFELSNLNLNIPKIKLSEENSADAGLEFDLSERGHFAMKGNYGGESSKFDVKIKIDGLDIDLISPYLQENLKYKQLNGLISTDIHLCGDSEHLLETSVNGFLALSNASLESEAGEIAAIDSALIAVSSIDLSRQKVSFSKIAVNGFRADYSIDKDGISNFARVTGRDREETVSEEAIEEYAEIIAEAVVDTTISDAEVIAAIPPETPEQLEIPGDTEFQTDSEVEQKPWDISIGSFLVSNSSVHYADYSMKEDFEYNIEDITLQSYSFSTTARNEVRIGATLDDGGKLAVLWRGEMSSLQNHALKIDMTGLDMERFSPFGIYMFGYNIAGGILNFTSRSTIEEGVIKSDNTLSVDQFKLGKKVRRSHPQYKIPVKTVVNLLTDKEGNMTLAIPVRGNLNDPRFSYRRILFKTLGKIITGSVPDDAAEIDDEPEDAESSEEATL
ncbi:MAG: DUF748 domain-containing protein, partial [Bacteroidales bacterium]|nr:DUF748 domain-containing protein [Bacteroidales bacterium]